MARLIEIMAMAGIMVMMAMGMVVSASDKVTAVDDGDPAIIHTLHPSVMVSFMYMHNLSFVSFNKTFWII